MKLAVHTPHQTSIGGNVFFRGLISALADQLDASQLYLSDAGLAEELERPPTTPSVDAVAVGLHLGAAVSTRCATNIFWPLSVAPVEPFDGTLFGHRRRDQMRPALMRLKLRRAIERANSLVFSSEYTRRLYNDRFSAVGILPTSVVTTGHSIDVPPPRHARQAPPPDRPARILWVGNAYPYKGLVAAVQATVAASREVEQPLVLDVVGSVYDDRTGKDARSLAASAPGRVTFHGPLHGDDLARMYREADVFLFTSRTENYGSFALADAFRFGLPTVSSSLSSTPEMAEGAALEVDPREPDSVASSLQELVTDPSTYEHWALQSFERGARLPSWSQVASQLLAAVRAST